VLISVIGGEFTYRVDPKKKGEDPSLELSGGKGECSSHILIEVEGGLGSSRDKRKRGVEGSIMLFARERKKKDRVFTYHIAQHGKGDYRSSLRMVFGGGGGGGGKEEGILILV